MTIKFDDILDIYEHHIYKGCKNKRKIYYFEKYKMVNIYSIYDDLVNDKYIMNSYNIFMIKHPKYRIVMSLNVRDKIVNHYITMYSLIPKLNKYLDNRNVATRKNMGVDYGIKLVKKYIELNKKYTNFYVLKLDISKYFYNIDHEVLKSMIIDKLDNDEYKIIAGILDSTNKGYINECIDELKNKELIYTNRLKEVKDIPYYNKGKGLPIGNMTSQFFAIFYLYELDHYIVNDLGIKYMIRYMDDYVLIHHDKEYLKKCMSIIEDILNNKYKLKLNVKKSRIYDINDGFDFLGYKFKVKNSKTICYVSRKTFLTIKKRIKKTKKNYKVDSFETIYSTVNNYYYGFKYGRSLPIKRYINREFFSNYCTNEK